MVKELIACVFTVFFALSSLACSGPSPKERRVGLTTAILPVWDKTKDGILPHEDHIYGFDRHPDIKNALVYVSVLNGESGFVTLKINYGLHEFFNFEYYICDLTSKYPYTLIENIDISKIEQKYTVTAKDDSVKIGLCRKSKAGTSIAQVLQIHPYNWREYDFSVYILGDSTKMDDRHQLLNKDEFWNSFDSVYAQAIVKHRNVSKKFIPNNRGYVLSRVAGTYGDEFSDTCAVGDIGRLINAIDTSAMNGENRRAIIQVGYPTKRFWPLKADSEGKIQICGEPYEFRYNLELELIEDPSKNCSTLTKASVTKEWEGWKLEYENGIVKEYATINDVNPECAVFVEASTSDRVGEISVRAAATTLRKNYASIVVLPWLGNLDSAKKVAFHEVGHTMGVTDLNDEPLSYIRQSRESNLMHYIGDAKGLKLRKRGIKTKDWGQKNEFQWDCLHKINVNKNCVMPIYDPYYPDYTD